MRTFCNYLFHLKSNENDIAKRGLDMWKRLILIIAAVCSLLTFEPYIAFADSVDSSILKTGLWASQPFLENVEKTQSFINAYYMSDSYPVFFPSAKEGQIRT
jgi:hypothetical protein